MTDRKMEDAAENKQPETSRPACCIIEPEDLEKVSGGGIFSDIVTQGTGFTPNVHQITKNFSGSKQ